MKRDDVIGIVIVALSFAAAIAIKLSGFSVMSIVLMQITIMFKMFVSTNGMNIFNSIKEVLNPFIVPIISLLFLSTAAALTKFVSDYRKLFLASLASMVAFVLFEHTIMGAIVSFAVFVLILLSKKTDMAFLLFDIIVSLGVFLVVLNNASAYQNSFRNGIKSLVKPIVRGEVSNLQNETRSVVYGVLQNEKSKLIYSVKSSNVPNKEELIYGINNNFDSIYSSYSANETEINIDPYIDEALDNSPMFQSTMKWFPAFVSLTAFFILEFLRVTVLVPFKKLVEFLVRIKIKEKEN